MLYVCGNSLIYVYFFVQGVQITVSTPALRTATALRFSTGNKIEMLVTNLSHQRTNHSPELCGTVLPMNILSLQGKVETEINVALGYLQVIILMLYVADVICCILLSVLYLLILILFL